MKKFLLLCGLFAMAMSLFAEETRRVAILETVDRQGNVSYASKLMLRSNLAKAITNTPGYEAYDRTDMDAIMGEQDFQRTGMVSNDQIKRLGEMTGAKYVLVAEAVVVDAHNMYITAKLLDVETARTVMTDNQLMGVTAKEIQRGCQLLAEKLIKPVVATTASNVKLAKQEKPAPVKQELPKQEKNQQEKLGVDTPVTGDFMVKLNSHTYKCGSNTMDKKAYAAFLKNNCPEAWHFYNTGNKAVVSGWVLFGSGMALICGGLGMIGMNHNFDGWTETFISLESIGAVTAFAGILSFSIGYRMKSKSLNEYNNLCSRHNYSMTVKVGGTSNGIGLALHF